MTMALARYRQLEEELVYVRWINRGFESEREDELLDAMEQVWWELDETEIAIVESTPVRSLIRSASAANLPRRLVDSNVDACPSCPPRFTAEAA